MSVVDQVKRAKLHNLLESVPEEIPDELITDIAESFAALVNAGSEQHFLLSAIGEELMTIAYRFDPAEPLSAQPV